MKEKKKVYIYMQIRHKYLVLQFTVQRSALLPEIGSMIATSVTWALYACLNNMMLAIYTSSIHLRSKWKTLRQYLTKIVVRFQWPFYFTKPSANRWSNKLSVYLLCILLSSNFHCFFVLNFG